MKELFLDCNAHLPMNQEAIDAFIETNKSLAGHGHALSPSIPGRSAETAIERARADIASILGAETPNNIFFTSTCTDACEWGLNIFSSINKDTIHFYTSPTEHPAVSQALSKLNKRVIGLDVDSNAKVKTNDLLPSSCAVCIFVQNEIGLVQPVFDIKTNSLFVDMSQAPGKINIPKLSSINNLDVAVFGAHKFGGPSSVGFVYIKDINSWSKKGTGSRYFLDRPGTPDVCSVVATAAALKEAIRTESERKLNMINFRDILEDGLESLGFEIIAKDAERVPGTTFAKVPEKYYSHLLMHKLGEKNIHIGLGSACGSTYSGKSPLLSILSKKGTVKDFIRISQFGDYSKTEAKYFIETLKNILNKFN